jgi:hypothetical protein
MWEVSRDGHFPVATGIFPTESPPCPRCGEADYNPIEARHVILIKQLPQLSALPAQDFTPLLDRLDDLIASIQIDQRFENVCLMFAIWIPHFSIMIQTRSGWGYPWRRSRLHAHCVHDTFDLPDVAAFMANQPVGVIQHSALIVPSHRDHPGRTRPACGRQRLQYAQ